MSMAYPLLKDKTEIFAVESGGEGIHTGRHGATILGGMLISTFFTLYVTPTMYLTLAKNTKRIDAVDIELKKELR